MTYPTDLPLYESDTVTRTGYKRTRFEAMDQANAIRAIQMGQPMLYAVMCPDGAIKIGCTTNLAQRRSYLQGEILAFRFGDFDDERAIHDSLREHLAHGDEYYHPSPEVLALVEQWRADLGIPALQS